MILHCCKATMEHSSRCWTWQPIVIDLNSSPSRAAMLSLPMQEQLRWDGKNAQAHALIALSMKWHIVPHTWYATSKQAWWKSNSQTLMKSFWIHHLFLHHSKDFHNHFKALLLYFIWLQREIQNCILLMRLCLFFCKKSKQEEIETLWFREHKHTPCYTG